MKPLKILKYHCCQERGTYSLIGSCRCASAGTALGQEINRPPKSDFGSTLVGKRDWKWCEDVVPFVMGLNESRKEYHRVGFSAQGCSSLGQAYAETSALGMIWQRWYYYSDNFITKVFHIFGFGTYVYVCNAFRMKVSFVIYLFYHIEVRIYI